MFKETGDQIHITGIRNLERVVWACKSTTKEAWLAATLALKFTNNSFETARKRPSLRPSFHFVCVLLFGGMINPFIANAKADLRSGVEDRVLFYLDNARKHPVRTRHIIENVGVFGSTGAGKSSGPDRTLAISEMLAGYSMLVSLPKYNSADELRKWAKVAGRENDVIIVDDSGATRFNVLDWLLRRKKNRRAVVKEVVDMIAEISGLSSRTRLGSGGNDQKFFQDMAERINASVAVVDLYANGALSPERCLQLITTIPATGHSAQNEMSPCREMCERALQNAPEDALREVRKAAEFLMVEMANLDGRVKSSCTVSATVLWSSLDRHPLDAMFTGTSTVTPDTLFEGNGKIIGIKLDLSQGADATIAFCIWKIATEKLLLDRCGQKNVRPCTILLQEAQNYVTAPTDYHFVALCRESTACYHYSSQSISSGLAQLPEKDFRALLACLNTKIFCQNTDETNGYASKLFGEIEVLDTGAGGQISDEFDPFSNDMLLKGANINISKKRRPAVYPEDFMRLKRGGGRDALVEAHVAVQMGDGTEGHLVCFDQNAGLRKASLLDWFRSRDRDVVTIA